MATGIKWTGETLNTVVGCTKISPGCKNCYALAVTKRWPARFPQGFDVTLKPERLAVPYTWKKPRLVFVNSMSDTFHTDVPEWYIKDIWRMFAATPQHTYQVLTKRPERMRYLFNENQLPYLPNVWLGVSAENQDYWDYRVPILADIAAPVRFVSCEPLLGPIDIFAGTLRVVSADETGRRVASSVDWVIVGGESGPGRRPMDKDWARQIEKQCRAAGVPFFYKQGDSLHAGHDDLLDGVAYKEIPEWGQA